MSGNSSWTPRVTIPAHFVQLLECESDSASEDERPFMDVDDQEEDGFLVPAENCVVEMSNSDDEGKEQNAVASLEMPSPLCSSAWNSPAAPKVGSSEAEPSDLEPRPSGSRGCGDIGATRKRGRAGLGRVSSGRRGKCVRGKNDTGCIRGQPLVERFSNDEELPQQVRDDGGRLVADHERQDRGKQERRADVGDSVIDTEEQVYHECNDFDWQPMDDWRGTKETFLPERPGPNRVYTDAYDAFRTIWDDTILSHIVTETNRYAQGIRGDTFNREWFDTTIDEILVLFAFWMMLGIIRMPTVRSCFSKIPIMRTDIFRHLFTERRYVSLLRAFDFVNGSSDPNDPGTVLYPMGLILEHLDSKFREVYTPKQDIFIDESLFQYVRTKNARFEIKTYELCESATGYVCSFFVYTGHRSTSEAKTAPETLPSSFSFVQKLARPFLNLGHVLYMDNRFNSPQLARYLKRRGTDCVGTLHGNPKDVPAVIQRAPLAEGQYVARQSGDVSVMALQDRKRFTLISTYHNLAQVQKEPRPGCPAEYKLQLIDDYNRGMRVGLVDHMDSMMEPYFLQRRQCKKWTKKLFKRYFNKSIQNARVLLEESSRQKFDSLAFRMSLVQSITDKHLRERRQVTVHRQPPMPRLTERHFIKRMPVTEAMRARTVHRNNLGRGVCVWCRESGRTNKTVYHCPDCKVALCLDRGCFELYHTVASPGS